MRRNWEALVLKALGGRDFRLTVLENDEVNAHYRRLRLVAADLLASCAVHPTMWIRLWFDGGGRPHQRAFTLVDPDPATGQFSLEFSLHDGRASDWARTAAPGDTIDATVQGSKFQLPDPPPGRWYAVGDPASLPALNSLLDAVDDAPVTAWLEYRHEAERDLPVRSRPGDTIHWVPRVDDGSRLLETVRAALPGGADAHFWLACEAGVTRELARHVRRDLGAGRHQLTALGYWSAGRSGAAGAPESHG